MPAAISIGPTDPGIPRCPHVPECAVYLARTTRPVITLPVILRWRGIPRHPLAGRVAPDRSHSIRTRAASSWRHLFYEGARQRQLGR